MAIDTCEVGAEQRALVRRGRLFRLKIERNRVARQEALGSIRDVPGGGFSARIGGRMRGRTETFASRKAAEDAVMTHYNLTLWKSLGLEAK